MVGAREAINEILPFFIEGAAITIQDGAEIISGYAEMTKALTEATKGDTEMIYPYAEMTKGGAEATKGRTEMIYPYAEMIKGGTGAVKGGAEMIYPYAETTKGGTEMICRYASALEDLKQSINVFISKTEDLQII